MAKGRSKVAVNASLKQTEKKETATPNVNWPPLAPVIPSIDLSLESLLEDQIVVIRSLFTSTLCKKLVSYLSTLPLTTTPGRPKRGEAFRVNDRFQIDDSVFANQLWEKTALKELVSSQTASIWGGDVLGVNPNIRVYRYVPGQFFDQHYDESNKLFFGPDLIPAKTTWTLLIYLTTCEGGETVFYQEPEDRKSKAPEPVSVSPELGLALLHRHGDDCLLHEGKEVGSGEKWVLRSDLIVRR